MGGLKMSTIKMSKLKAIIVTLVIGLAFFGMAFATIPTKAGAEGETTSTTFKVKGTSVRYVEAELDKAVKFHLVMDKTSFDGLSDEAVTGMAICPEVLLDESGFENAENENIRRLNAPKSGWFENADGLMELVVYVYDIPDKNLGTTIAVAGYYTVDGNTAHTSIAKTSLAYTAKAAADQETDEDKKAQLSGYYTFTVNYYSGEENVESASAIYGETLAEPTYDACKWTNKSGTSVWSFNTTVSGNVNLYAVAHNYGEAKSHDADFHWTECSVCGNRKDETSHTFKWVTLSDGGRNLTCSDCGYTKAYENVPAEEVSIYTVSKLPTGETYENEVAYAPVVKEDGKDVAVTVTVEDENIAVYEDGKIKGVANGTTNVKVTYTLLGTTNTETFAVNVTRPVVEYSKEVPYFSAMDGTHEIFDTLFDGVAITEANQIYNNETIALTVKENVLSGMTTSSKYTTFCELDIYTATYGYKLTNVKAYTKVISKASDFEALKLTADRKTIEGYFIMKNDVDFNTYDFDGNGVINYYDNIHPYYNKDSKKVEDGFTADLTTAAGVPQKTGGFIGTFEGNSCKIKGYRAGNSFGLFGTISGTTSDYTTIRNVGFVDTLAEAANWTRGRLFAEYATCVRVENVYISFANNSASKYSNWTTNLALFGWTESVYFRFNNVIIDYSSTSEKAATGAENNAVGFFAYAQSTNWYGTGGAGNQWHSQMKTVYQNVYAIAPKAANGRVMPLHQSTTMSVYAINDITDIPTDGSAISLDGTTINPVANESGSMKIFHWLNAYRYDSYADMVAAGKTNIGNWVVSDSGVVWKW